MTAFLITADPGLEDVAADEIRSLDASAEIECNPFGYPGHLRVDLDKAESLWRARTIHNITRIHRQTRAVDLDAVRREVAATSIDEMNSAKSFRVTSTRLGDHGFGRTDIEGASGAAVQRRYGTPVDLENPEVTVRVDLYDGHLLIGVQKTERSLSHRLLRARSLRTALKPTVAAAMVRLAGAHRGTGALIDPLCGTGTIPVEAKQIRPQLEVFAGDWDEETVEVARETVANHELDIDVRVCDARTLSKHYDRRFDFIVTDPPYGLRQARRAPLARFYGEILTAFEAALSPTGRIAVIVLKLHAFRAGLERTSLRVVHERVIDSGGIHPRIYLLEHGEPD